MDPVPGRLVFLRKVGERVCIGDGIVVTVVSVERGKCRLGFQAARDIKIWRKEIHDEIQEQEAVRTQ